MPIASSPARRNIIKNSRPHAICRNIETEGAYSHREMASPISWEYVRVRAHRRRIAGIFKRRRRGADDAGAVVIALRALPAIATSAYASN